MANKYKSIDYLIYGILIISIFVFLNRQFLKNAINLDGIALTKLSYTCDTIINFGVVSKKDTINFEGYIKNEGQCKLYIVEPKATCGCTNFEITKKEIPINDSSLFTFKIKPSIVGKDIITLSFKANTNKKLHKIRVAFDSK